MPAGYTPPPGGNDWGAFANAQPAPFPTQSGFRFVVDEGPPLTLTLQIQDSDGTWEDADSWIASF